MPPHAHKSMEIFEQKYYQNNIYVWKHLHNEKEKKYYHHCIVIPS